MFMCYILNLYKSIYLVSISNVNDYECVLTVHITKLTRYTNVEEKL